MSADKCKFVINVSDEGEMFIQGMDYVQNFCKKFPGQRLSGLLTLERTKEQNAGLHLWFQIIANDIGESDIEEIKREIKSEMGWYTVHTDKQGNEYREFESTAKWGKRECSEKMEKMKIWVHQYLGIVLPDLDPDKRR